VVSPNPLCPIPSISSVMKTPENTRPTWCPWTSRWNRYANGIL